MYLEGQNMYSMNNSYLLYPQNYQTIVQSQYPLAFRGEGSLKPQLETPVQPRGINQTALLTAQSVPSFQGAANAIKTLPNDTVEINGKKKTGMSSGAKVGLGILGTVATLCIAVVAISKHQRIKLEKLYKEKLVSKIFDKEIQFTDAKTKDEAIKYAKEVLGVGSIDDKMTLDMLNYANHGITNVVNKNIGQEVFIPRSYFCDNKGGDGIAYVVRSIESKRFGELGLNVKFFDDKYLTEELDKSLGLRIFAQSTQKGNTKQSESYGFNFVTGFSKEAFRLYEKYVKNPDALTILEKRRLLFENLNCYNKLKTFDFESFIKDNKLKINLEDFSNLHWTEKPAALRKYCVDNKLKLKAILDCTKDDFHIMYHELGHLQDYAKNLKNIHIKNEKITSFKEFCAENEAAKKEGRKIHDARVEELGNRFRGTTYTGFAELLKNNPEKFQKLYPDLYEHLTNKEIQKTAGKVSAYAQTSIGEFIADTYAKMIQGDSIPDDVMKLYKKYNGPLLKGM